MWCFGRLPWVITPRWSEGAQRNPYSINDGDAREETGTDSTMQLSQVSYSSVDGSNGPEAGAETTCSDCGRVFSKKAGLTIHRKKCNPLGLHDERRLVATGRRIKRCSDDEIKIVAMAEAELIKKSVVTGRKVRFMNVELSKSLGYKTEKDTERIRYIRTKTAGYKDLLARLVADQSDTTDETGNDNGSESGSAQAEGTWKAQLKSWLFSNSKAISCLLVDELTLNEDQSDVDAAFEGWVKGKVGRKASTEKARSSIRVPRQLLSKRQRKKRRYRETMLLYRKNPGEMVKRVLEDREESPVESVERQVLHDYWRAAFTTGSVRDDRNPEQVNDTKWDLLAPIEAAEVGRAIKLCADTAAGPDKLTKADIVRLGEKEIAEWFNLFLLLGRLPHALMGGVCSLIPKVNQPTDPSEFRPIVVTSKLRRLFHSIIAKRMGAVPLSLRQKGFRAFDGAQESTFIVRSLIDRAKRERKPLALAFLDVKNAFGSASHESLFKAAARMGVPAPMVAYLRDLYSRETIIFKGCADRFVPNVGSLQGDPLSGVLFNFLIDWAASALSPEFGVKVGSENVNHGLFADDAWLCADTMGGLQMLTTQYSEALGKVGCILKPSKCASLNIGIDGKRQLWYCDDKKEVTIGGVGVKALKVNEAYRYLGLNESVEGTSTNDTFAKFMTQLKRVTSSLLKPQWKLAALRTNIIPGLHHTLVLSNCSIGCLKRFDVQVRRAVRLWLHLPKDVPNSMIHASVDLGGIGVPIVSTNVLRMREERRKRMTSSNDQLVKLLLEENPPVWKNRVPKVGGVRITGKGQQQALEGNLLHSTVDGAGLKNIGQCPKISGWVNNARLDCKGGDFVKAMQVRCNSLQTMSRQGRGSNRQVLKCRRCNAPETLNHLQQVCSRCKDDRDRKHDNVVTKLVAYLRRRGWHCDKEKQIRRDPTWVQPDVIAYKPGKAIVIDPTIVTHHTDFVQPWDKKVSDYNRDDVLAHATKRLRTLFPNSPEVPPLFEVVPLVYTWRGALYARSWSKLKELVGFKFLTLRFWAFDLLVDGWHLWNRVKRLRTDTCEWGNNPGRSVNRA